MSYVLCLIKRNELSKKLFVSDIEEGGEVYIPNELRNTNLPPSFHFYDPVLGIVHEKMKCDRAEYFIKRSQIVNDF